MWNKVIWREEKVLFLAGRTGEVLGSGYFKNDF